MKNLIKSICTVACIVIATSCNQESGKSFELKGALEGINDGKIILFNPSNSEIVPDTAEIKNGKFVFRGDIPEPAPYYLQLNDQHKFFFAENTKMTFTGHADSLNKGVVQGGRVNDDYSSYMEKLKALQKKHRLNILMDKIIAADPDGVNIPEQLQKEFDSAVVLFTADRDSIVNNYIRENPSSFYSAVLIEQQSYGRSAEEIENLLKLLDPSLSEYTLVEDLYKLADNLKHSDVGVTDFITDAPDITYRADTDFKGTDHKNIVYFTVLSNDNICCLSKEGNVIIIDGKGNKLSQFNPDLKSEPSAIAADLASNEIYVLGTLTEKTKKVVRGKEYEIVKPIGVECLVFDSEGKPLREIFLKDLKSATGAKVTDGKIFVADYERKMISVFNTGTGVEESSIKDLRVCCGILDFGINNNNEILIANLGAFRVNVADFTGQNKFAFGKRGQTLNEFHGCCNPVNVSALSTGAIITVEKDPTRVKVYSKEGAKKIEGIEELVQGCRFIPIVIDSKNNIYLASANKGLIKCIAN